MLVCFANAHLQAQASSIVDGIFLAPPGTNIVLQNNNPGNLLLLAKKSSVDASADAFKFLKPLAKAVKCKISVKSLAPGLDGKITNGNGLLPITGNGVKVEGDCQFDLVSRSKVFGTCPKPDARFPASGIFAA